MHDCDHVRDLERGVPVNVDCSSSERVTAVSYQQSPHVGLLVSPKQSKKLDISCQLPETYLSGNTSVQASCATDASDVAKFSATLEAHAGHLTTTATANKPGTTNTEFELTGRSWALLLKRFLHSKLQLGCTHRTPSAKYSSSAEVAVPDLTQNLSCKAHATTDFCQRLVLHADLQWKARHKQTKSAARQTDKVKASKAVAQHGHDDNDTNHNQHVQRGQPAWYSESATRLPWRDQSLHYPSPEYACKPRPSHRKASSMRAIKVPEADKDSQDGKDEAQAGMGPGDQCTLQLKGSTSGKPCPLWQIRGQKALGPKLQLRAQASAAPGVLHLLPSQCQVEARHKLLKDAMLSVRLHREERRPSQQHSRHRLQIEHKGRSNWITWSCAQEASGYRVGLKAKASSGKGKLSHHQKWQVFFHGSVHVGSRLGLVPKLKAEISSPF